MSVISYRTKIDRKFLEKAAVKTLKYPNVNAFIEHAVSTTLKAELASKTPAEKMVQAVTAAVLKHYPLNFKPASAKDEKAMLKDLADLKSGKVKAVRVSRATRHSAAS
jgi:hypothetical protein